MLFESFNSKKLINHGFIFYALSCLILTVIILVGFDYYSSSFQILISGLLFLFISSFLTLNKAFRGNPLSIVLIQFTFLYINIPLCYIIYQGSEYTFGSKFYDFIPLIGSEGLIFSFLPFSQHQYEESFSSALLFLIACWTATWAALSLSAKKVKKFKIKKNQSNVKIWPIVIVGIFICVFHLYLHQQLLISVENGEPIQQNKIATLFSYNGFLIACGVLLLLRLNARVSIKENFKESFALTFIFAIFVIYQYSAGGKAALLQISLSLILVPIILSGEFFNSRVYFIKYKYLLILLLLSPFLYYFTNILRMTGEFQLIDYLLVSEYFDRIGDNSKKVFIRLAQNGLDMYLLIYKSFIGVHYDSLLSYQLITYILKNSVNLILPGTIFYEAYAPSGQFLIEVINRDFIGWQHGLDSNKLYTSLNTSAYTFFGETIIFFNIFAPLLIFIITYFFSKLYYMTSSIIIKSIFAYAFIFGLISYGIDGTIGDSFNTLLSTLIIYYLILFLSLLKINTNIYPFNQKNKFK